MSMVEYIKGTLVTETFGLGRDGFGRLGNEGKPK